MLEERTAKCFDFSRATCVMSIMGFIRQQEENLAVKLLQWQYQRMNRIPPDDAATRQQAGKVVDDAHRIAREKGRNVLTIIRELVDDLKRK